MIKKILNYTVVFAMLFSVFSTTNPVQASAFDDSAIQERSLPVYREEKVEERSAPVLQKAPQPELLADEEQPIIASTPVPMRAPVSKESRTLGLGTGIYDDTQIGVNWSGGWTSVADNNALGGSYHSSTTVGNSASFQYSGSKFSLFFIKAPGRGSVQIKIDGNIVATFSMSAATVQYSQVWDTPIQQDAGPHTVTVTHLSGGQIVFDGFEISNPDPATPLDPGYYEDNSNLLQFNGAWTSYSAASASAENVHYSTAVSSSCTFNFSGNQFKVIYTGYSNRGILAVYVDGVLVGSVNEYSAQVAWQQVWTSPLLESSSSHSVELRHASGAVVEVDAVEILDVTLPDSVGPGTYEENDTNLSYTGQWLTASPSQASGGAVLYSLVPNNAVSLRFTGNQFSLIYTGFPNRGSMGVFIDGQQIGSVNQYSPSVSYQNRWTSPLLDNTGPHLLEFRHMSGDVVELDAVTIYNNTAVGTGLYESDDIHFSYVGQWASATPTGASGQEVAYSTTIGNSTSLRFAGNQIRLIYTGLSNRGVMGVYINGELIDSVNEFSAAVAFQSTWTSPVLDNTGPHTLELRHLSGAVAEVDAVLVLENDPLVPGTYENTDPNLSYSGQWKFANASSASDGSVHYSTSIGNSVSLRFAGHQASLIYTGYPNRGVMGVYIDGQLAGSVNEYTASASFQNQWDSPVLSSTGPHTLEFKHESGQVVELDAVVIAATPVPTVTPEPTESPIFYPPDGKEMYRASFAPNESGETPASTSANHDSYGLSISRNGRYTAFSSLATNLIFGTNVCNTDGQEDVYLHDRQTRTNQCVSTLYGAAVDGASTDAAIDASGDYVVFVSDATAFTSGSAPAGIKQVYVWHRTSNNLYLVSEPEAGGFANGDCYDPFITPGGQYIAFSSDATNLVGDDDNGKTDVFVRNMGDIGGDGVYSGSNASTMMVSRTLQGGPLSAGALGSIGSYISDDGQKIAYTSDSPDLTGDASGSLRQVFLYDQATGTTITASGVSDGQGGRISSDDDAWVYGVSRDGLFVMFYSTATNLVSGGDATEDAYIYDVVADSITLISVPDGQAIDPFPEIVDGKLLFETTKALMAIDVNNQKDVYMRESDGTIKLISLPVGAAETGSYASHSPVISQDGRYVVFQSSVNALDPVDSIPVGGEPILENIYIRAIDDEVLVLDNTAPNLVTDLDAQPGTENGEAFLTWTSTGDDGMEGQASTYDIRYSLAPITTEDEWDLASHVDGEIDPDEPGFEESMTITGLDPGKIYYFAIKVGDEVPNWSALSNNPSAMTPGIAPSEEGVYEDDSGSILYKGSWVSYPASRASGGNVHYSTSPGSTATLHFSGNKIRLVYTGYTNRGTAEIYIDGQLVASVNEYASTAAFQSEWTSDVLDESGAHVLDIKHASGSIIEVDAVEVFDIPAPAPLEQGLYQEDEANLIYEGEWTIANSSMASGNATRYSLMIGNKISTRFTGNRVNILFTGYPNRGIMGVYVDGQKIGVINQYAPEVAWQQQWKSPILGDSGTHSLELRHESGAVVELDALTIIQVDPVSAGFYEENNENLVYSGEWTSASASNASGGSVRYSKALDNQIALQFTGNQFSIVYTGLSNRGKMGVYVDGQKVGTVNEYAATVSWKQRWYSPILSDSGSHLLELKHESGAVVELDAIEILDRAPSGAGTYQDDDPNLSYRGEWKFANPTESSGGTVRYSLVPGNAIGFLFTGTKATLVFTGMPNRGVVGVYVDGMLIGTANEYRDELSWQQTWESPVLSDAGPHNLELKHETGAVIELDALIIE